MSSMTGYKGSAGGNLQGREAGNIIPKGFNLGQLQQFTPEQMQLFQRMFSQVNPDSYLSRLAGGDEAIFRQTEAPAWSLLNQAQGQLGSRFAGTNPGQLSSRNSSAFNQAGNQLSQDFAMNLASNRQALQRQALLDMMGISQSLLGQKPYEQFLTEKPKSFLQQLGISASGGLGHGIGLAGAGAASGGLGALTGLLGKLFRG